MSRYRDSGSSSSKIYVGDLGSSASKQELEEAFSYYGTLRNVWVARNPPGFAFVEFEDSRDAEDAVRGLDGRTICGRRVRVEMSNGMSGKGRFRGLPLRRGRPFHPEDRCYECGDRGHYARDCYHYRSSRGPRRSYSRSRSRSRSRSQQPRVRSRSGTRSRSRDRHSRSGSHQGSSKDQPQTRYAPRDRSHSKSKHSRSYSRSRSRSRASPERNGNNHDDARD